MPTARRIEIPISGDCPSFGDKHSNAIDAAAAVTEGRRNNGDISDGTRENDVSVAEGRLNDHVQRASNDEPEEPVVDRDDQEQCSKEDAKNLDVTQKQSQELLLQTNVPNLGPTSNQSVLHTRSSSKYEGPAQHTLHGGDKIYDERTGMREVNVDLYLDNQIPQQQQLNAPTHLASGQSTTTCQAAQNYCRRREPQPQQSQLEDELTRNYQLPAQNTLLLLTNQISSQTRQEECDSDLSQSTNRLSSERNVSLQQKQEHGNLQQRLQPELQTQPHQNEVFMHKEQQNLQNINTSLDHPQWQQERQQQQLSSLTNCLYPNGFLQHGVPHQEYQHHGDIHQFNSNRINSSDSAKSYQHNYRHQANQLHTPSQNIPYHATWQCTKCYQAHPSFIRTCPCVYGSKSHFDQTKISNGTWQRMETQHPGQQQHQPLYHQYNYRARSTASDFQPLTHYQRPLVHNTVRKPQWQQHHCHHPEERHLNNEEKSSASDFEPLSAECHQKPMVQNPSTGMTFLNDLPNKNRQSSLSNDNEPRHRTKKVAHRQCRHDSDVALIDLTAGNEGESKSESEYFNSNNAHGPSTGNQASLSQRLNVQPIRQGEMGNNQNYDGNDYKRGQSVHAHETTVSTHNVTRRVNYTHVINRNRTIRAPKSLTRAIEDATSLPQLEGLRHHLKMMLEKVEEKINRALFDKAVNEFDITYACASANQPPSDDDMASDPNEIHLQRQTCCPICFSFEDKSAMPSSNSTKRQSYTCPICEEPDACQDCRSKCSVCKRLCCLDCMQSCDNCALHYCFDCSGYSISGSSGESAPKAVKEKRLCRQCVVNSMSGSWMQNAGVQVAISKNHFSKSCLKRKRSNETATQEKRVKTIPSKNAALLQHMTKQPVPAQKMSRLPGRISEASNDPTLQNANHAVCHKFIIQHEGKLGVHITPDPRNPMCTIISRVEIGSPADIYGIKAGDRIFHHDDNPNVKRTYKLTRDWLIDRLKRRPTSISVWRRCPGDGSERHVIYALDSAGGKRPLSFVGDFCASIHRFVFNDDRDLGMSIGEWPTGKGYSYTIVKNVESGSLAETHGIRKGDIISKTTEDGRLVTGLSQWITTKIRGKPPFRFEILRLHKIDNSQQPKDKIFEYQQEECPKINVLPKESNETKHQNATAAVKEANSGQTAACYSSKDSKNDQTKVSESPTEPIIEEPVSTKTSQNSHSSEVDSVRCGEGPVNERIGNPDPSHLDDNRRNPTHCATVSGHEVASNGSMPNSPHEETNELLSVTDANHLESFQNLVHKSDPTYKIGTKLWKKFLDDNGKKRPFEGIIESYDPNEGFYKIVYEDGDEEELTERQVSKLLQKNKIATDENRPLLIGKLSLVEKDGKCLHSIRGYWHFENHHRIPSQTFELLRKDPSDEVFSTEQPLAANGEYYGSFVYEWKDPSSKETLTAVIKESNVVIDFEKEGQEGEAFLIKGKGINQYGIFELNGQASKDTKNNDNVYNIHMHKTYLKPDTAS